MGDGDVEPRLFGDDSNDDKRDPRVYRNPRTEQPLVVPYGEALKAERPYRAHQLHLRGLSWGQVAAEEGYLNAQAAKYDVDTWLEQGRALVQDSVRRDMLRTEVARLDELQATVWPMAMKGHLPAVRQVMDLVMNRAKLIGLGTFSKSDEDESDLTPETVIIPGDDTGFVSHLQALTVAKDETGG